MNVLSVCLDWVFPISFQLNSLWHLHLKVRLVEECDAQPRLICRLVDHAMWSRSQEAFLFEVFALTPAFESVTDVDSERAWNGRDIDPLST